MAFGSGGLEAGQAFVDLVPRLSPGFANETEKLVGQGIAPAGQRITNDLGAAGAAGGTAAGTAAATNTSKTLTAGATGLAKSLTGVFAGIGAVSVIGDAIDEAREAIKVGQLTEAVIKSTGGVAGVTAEHVEDLADSLSRVSGVDDDLIQAGENVLLTFTSIRNEAGEGNNVFDRATTLALDMSRALGTDLQGSIIQVGKALNDPIKGVTALQRVGVSFTESQKEQIKTLVETGDVLGAQRLILDELTKEFGGAAEAAADPMDKAQVAAKNLEEALGLGLLPVITDLANIFADDVAPVITTVLGAFNSLPGPLKTVITLFLTLGIGIKVFSSLFGGLSLLLNPWILAILAVIAVGFLLVDNWEEIEGFLSDVWDTIASTAEDVWNGIKDFFAQWWPLILGVFTGGIGLVVGLLIQNWDDVVAFTEEVWDSIVDFFNEFWPIILGIFTGGLALVVGLIIQNWDEIKAFTIEAFNAVIAFLVGVWDFIVNLFTTAVSTVWNIVTSGFNAVVAFIAGIPGAIIGFLSGLVGALFGLFTDALNGVINAVVGGFNNVVGFVAGIPGAILGALGSIGSLLFNAGVDLIQGFLNGITSLFGTVLDTVSGFVSDVVDEVTGFLGIGSPSKVFIGIGEDVMEGLAEGLSDTETVEATVALKTQRLIDVAARLPEQARALGLRNLAAGLPANTRTDTTGGGGVTIQGPLIAVERLEVRDDADVVNLSRELSRETARQLRARGDSVPANP